MQQFYLVLIHRSQSMSVSLSSLCKWETWDMGRDSGWFRSAGNVKARNAILLLWVLRLLCGVLQDAMVSVSGLSSPSAVTPGFPLSLMDLQLSYSRLDLNKELGRDVWLTHWFTMFTLSGWSPFKNRNAPSFLTSSSSTETRDNFYFIKKRNQWTWPLPKIPPKLLI